MNKKYLLLAMLIFVADVSFASPKLWAEEWPKTDFGKTSINLDDVISGGPGKDGISSIDNPKFKLVSEIDNIPLSEPVISVHIGDEARAYPLRILIWHEIVNDTIGETPILVTYCPLCSAAIVFDRRVDGVETEFGVSGKLHKSDMIMYDRGSESWWQQYTGEGVVGQQLGQRLQLVTSRVESLRIFRDRFPNGKVLVPNDVIRSYGANPYPGYDSSFPFLYKGKYGGVLPQMTYLLVVENEAWPLALLAKKRIIKTENLILRWFPNQNSVLDTVDIDKGWDVGNVIAMREVEKGVYEDVPYRVTFSFVFDAFHPDGVVHMK